MVRDDWEGEGATLVEVHHQAIHTIWTPGNSASQNSEVGRWTTRSSGDDDDPDDDDDFNEDQTSVGR